MNGFTFSPALGWVAGGLLAAGLAVLAILEIALFVRRRASIRRTLMLLIVAVMVLTPSVVSSTTSQAINATDVIVAVDTTGSMAVADATYGSEKTITRIDAARQAVHDVTAAYPDASFAALRFGASGTLDVPLTPDAPAIDNWANTLAVEATSVSAGSSLDAPIDQLLLTVKSIREAHPDDAIVLYLITDGEQTSNVTRRTRHCASISMMGLPWASARPRAARFPSSPMASVPAIPTPRTTGWSTRIPANPASPRWMRRTLKTLPTRSVARMWP